MSAYVKKIQFKLHESYGNPLRGQQFSIMWLYKSLTTGGVRWLLNLRKVCIFILVVTKPPYEITETGWGEFEIIIKIFFIDPNERPVSVGSIHCIHWLNFPPCLSLYLCLRWLCTICWSFSSQIPMPCLRKQSSLNSMMKWYFSFVFSLFFK